MATSTEVFGKIAALGIEVPPLAKPSGLYEMVTIHAGIAYTSGQLSRLDNAGALIAGRMQANSPLDQAVRGARVCLMRALVALHDRLGDLSCIEKFLFVRGFINADADFTRHSQVLDHVSQLIQDLFGADVGSHSRSALGAGSLPSNGLVEIEFTVALKQPTQISICANRKYA